MKKLVKTVVVMPTFNAKPKAAIAGLLNALELRADCVIEMDGDFFHPTQYLSDFPMVMKLCDVVIGLRMISQGFSIVEAVLYYCLQQGFFIKAIPIFFEDRSQGKSKLILRIL